MEDGGWGIRDEGRTVEIGEEIFYYSIENCIIVLCVTASVGFLGSGRLVRSFIRPFALPSLRAIPLGLWPGHSGLGPSQPVSEAQPARPGQASQA